jgi:hypothetical protein
MDTETRDREATIGKTTLPSHRLPPGQSPASELVQGQPRKALFAAGYEATSTTGTAARQQNNRQKRQAMF